MIESEAGESYRVLAGRAACGLVLLCDHAGNARPPEYGTLGLPPAELERHIAYDIGAAAVTERLAGALGAPAVLSRYSRLLIDLNRGEDDPTLIMRLSDGAVIPGNNNLTAAERRHRVARYYKPYHEAVHRVVARCLESGHRPIVLSVHSMTHAWKGAFRPWHVAILWHLDRRLATPLLDGFRGDRRLHVGENEPYHGGLVGDTLWQHARPYDLPGAVIEYRQDLVADANGQQQWADATARILKGILGARANEQMETPMSTTSPATETELEAAAYRRLVAHLRTRTDVQNIDLMNLAGFCRNCLANWYQEAAAAQGRQISKDAAREIVYGMPYKEWQTKHQKEVSIEQKAAFEKSGTHKH